MKERTMQTISQGVLAVLFTLSPAITFAQAGTPATTATDVSTNEVQAATKKAIQELLPGVSASDHLISLPDMGKYKVGVAVVARPAGTFQTYLSHDKITEIYYILRGSGTQVTGTLVNGRKGNTVSPTIGPSLTSDKPLENGRSSRLGPGDIQIIPPGVGHGWTSIDAGGVEYLIFRIDADHVLAVQ
jgi:mannose-6-phosphate isomerase-like protein (cupin superfamily)